MVQWRQQTKQTKTKITTTTNEKKYAYLINIFTLAHNATLSLLALYRFEFENAYLVSTSATKANSSDQRRRRLVVVSSSLTIVLAIVCTLFNIEKKDNICALRMAKKYKKEKHSAVRRYRCFILNGKPIEEIRIRMFICATCVCCMLCAVLCLGEKRNSIWFFGERASNCSTSVQSNVR